MIQMTNHSDRTYHRPGGFTLVELLVSIALVVILIIGINMVFTSAGKTIGTGMAVSDATRGFRSAYTTIRNDIERDPANTVGMLPVTTTALSPLNATPSLVIMSQLMPNQPVDDKGTLQDCRIDTLSFFAQATGAFKRQTGNPNELFANMIPADHAFIWYGHLYLPDNSGGWTYPTNFPGRGNASTNPNNYYARDWRLGRVVIGVRAPDVNNQIIDYSGNAQRYIARAQENPLLPDTTSLAPFSLSSNTTMGGPIYACSPPLITDSLCDLAGVNLNWYRDNVFSVHAAGDAAWGHDHFGPNYRFRANPFVTRPITVNGAAQSVPIFLNGCMSFKVEFAGNLSNAPGGLIDRTNDGTGIQWYGMPVQYGPNPIGTNPRDVMTVTQKLGATPIYEHVNADGTYTWAWSQYELGSQPVGNGNPNGGRPSLIRLTITLTDSNGRLPSGMTQEFIFEVPKN